MLRSKNISENFVENIKLISRFIICLNRAVYEKHDEARQVIHDKIIRLMHVA